MTAIRERINSALKQAMKAQDKPRLATLRLIVAALRDQDIARRTGQGGVLQDADILAILSRMTRQCQDSVRAYEEGGRIDLADQERRDIAIIAEFLPRPLDNAEVAAAIQAAITATGATGVRDMGRVMGHLKRDFPGRMDFAQVGAIVKDHLT